MELGVLFAILLSFLAGFPQFRGDGDIYIVEALHCCVFIVLNISFKIQNWLIWRNRDRKQICAPYTSPTFNFPSFTFDITYLLLTYHLLFMYWRHNCNVMSSFQCSSIHCTTCKGTVFFLVFISVAPQNIFYILSLPIFFTHINHSTYLVIIFLFVFRIYYLEFTI